MGQFNTEFDWNFLYKRYGVRLVNPIMPKMCNINPLSLKHGGTELYFKQKDYPTISIYYIDEDIISLSDYRNGLEYEKCTYAPTKWLKLHQYISIIAIKDFGYSRLLPGKLKSLKARVYKLDYDEQDRPIYRRIQ